ncbi:MAG: competence type IV pilus major pilin ComGC [Bacillota bacterium]
MSKHLRYTIKNEEGFTLIEMLIVMSIIAILLILITPKLADHQENITLKSDEAIVGFVNTQIQAYYLDSGTFPLTIETLETEGYIEEDLISSASKEIVFTDASNKKVMLVSE